MLKSVTFSGTVEVPMTVKMVRPDKEGFIIRNIKNLGAGKADIHTSGRASLDGDIFNGARSGSRNLVFSFGYGHRMDPERGRDVSYDLFPLKEYITMQFETDSKTVEISGWIESNEPNIFTKDPSFDVSIICTDPKFRSPETDRVTFKLYTLEDKFEFPFENDSLVENKLIMGEYDLSGYGELRYEGSETTGILVRFICTGPVVHPSITNDRTNQTMRIDTDRLEAFTGFPLVSGDIVEINTVRGSRSVYLIRDGMRTSILNALSSAAEWITLKKGINPISINTDSGFSNLQTEIIHDTYYAGI